MEKRSLWTALTNCSARFLKALRGRMAETALSSSSLIEPRLPLTSYEQEQLPSGGVRWEALVRWHSIGYSKAGYLKKFGGTWSFTSQSEQEMKPPPGEFIRSANRSYRAWKSQQPSLARALLQSPRGWTRDAQARHCLLLGSGGGIMHSKAVARSRSPRQ